jgi:tetraacyldisaccharide 4'-kinase
MWKVLLIPFSLAYGLALRVRHLLYDTGVFKSQKAVRATFVIGNLCAGGSGKTPHMLKFAQWISTDFKIATLSRGYGRKSSGFRLVESDSDASESGDEPLLLKKNLPDVPVAVCENRLLGIEQLADVHPDIELVLLDDAFQHRPLKPDFSVLLIPHSDLLSTRYLLPAGNQRDLWQRYKKADIIIVTRCPDLNDGSVLNQVRFAFHEFPMNAIFLSATNNSAVRSFDGSRQMELNSRNFPKCILVTGLSGGRRLKTSLEKKGLDVLHFEFPDHHMYSLENVNKIMQASAQKHPIFTTGKDRVKIEVLLGPALEANWYELTLELMFDREKELKKLILQHVTKHKRSS